MSAPFGIEIYSPIESLKVLEGTGPWYMVAAPRPHPRFEKYAVQGTPNVGVYWVQGISASVANDAFGTGVRNLKDELEAQVSQRYGRGKSMDFLLPGSIWTDDRDYIMSLTQNERKTASMWERPAVDLPDDLEAIILAVHGEGTNTAWVGLEYFSSKVELAEAEIQDTFSDLL